MTEENKTPETKKEKLKTLLSGLKTKKNLSIIAGAVTLIAGWIVTSVFGVPIPDEMVQAIQSFFL